MLMNCFTLILELIFEIRKLTFTFFVSCIIFSAELVLLRPGICYK